MVIDPNSAVVAYCAPGMKDYVTSVLDHETVREVIEDPAMTGLTNVRLVADPIYTQIKDKERAT
jgi:hypothetical protein